MVFQVLIECDRCGFTETHSKENEGTALNTNIKRIQIHPHTIFEAHGDVGIVSMDLCEDCRLEIAKATAMMFHVLSDEERAKRETKRLEVRRMREIVEAYQAVYARLTPIVDLKRTSEPGTPDKERGETADLIQKELTRLRKELNPQNIQDMVEFWGVLERKAKIQEDTLEITEIETALLDEVLGWVQELTPSWIGDY